MLGLAASDGAVRRRLMAGAAALATMLGVALPHVAGAAGPTWTALTVSGPAAGVYDAAAYEPDAGVDVLFTSSGQTWTWNGSAWTNVSPAPPALSPSAREAAAMAYDPVRKRVVLFGGSAAGSWLGDTWLWDETALTWTPVTPSLSPPNRQGAAMAWDGAVGRLVLFGGYGGPGLGAMLGDTWAWDGTSWNELVANFVTIAAGPAPRTNAQIAFDETHNRIVLFGGATYSGALNDTWTWLDGAGNAPGHWSEAVTQNKPPARYGGAFAHSPNSTSLTLFGGAASSTSVLSDTWTWDSGNWTQQAPTGQPGARYGAAAATNPDGNILMFGGQRSGPLSDSWVWSGPPVLTTPTLILSCPYVPTVSSVDSSGSTFRALAAAHHPGLYVGAALPAINLLDSDVATRDLAASQYNLVASSNQMYWSATETQQNVYDFCDGDQFVGFTQQYGESLRFHNLLAGNSSTSQLPNWLIGGTWTKPELEQVLKDYITTVMTHYRGKVSVWDVVNETTTVNPNTGQAVPMDNVFSRVIGWPDYVVDAFQDARAVDPTAKLLYDDGNWYSGAQQDLEYSLIQTLTAKSLVDVVGFELYGGRPSRSVLDTTFSRFAALGVQTAVTQMTVPSPSELDTSVVTANPTDLQVQSGYYLNALNACLDAASNCHMFFTWGISDTYNLANDAAVITLSPCRLNCSEFAPEMWDVAWRPKPVVTDVQTRLSQP